MQVKRQATIADRVAKRARNNKGQGATRLLILQKSEEFERFWSKARVLRSEKKITGYLKYSEEEETWSDITEKEFQSPRFEQRTSDGGWIEISREKYNEIWISGKMNSIRFIYAEWDSFKKIVWGQPSKVQLYFNPTVRAPRKDYSGKDSYLVKLAHPENQHSTIVKKIPKAFFIDFEKEIKSIFLEAFRTDDENLWMEFLSFVFVDVIA